MGQGHWTKACALALVAIGTSQASAQEDNAAKAAARRLHAHRGVTVAAAGSGEAERRIEAALREPLRTPFDFVETPLSTIMQVISEEYDIPIQFDVPALEAVAQSPDTEVTVNLRNISLRSALDLLFRGTEDLAYVIDHEVLLITTEDEMMTRLEVRVYRVDDLLLTDGEGVLLAGNADYDTLIDTVVSNIEADSWAENGSGEGEIQPFSPGMLVVSQTRGVHEQIGELFETLRAIKADVLADEATEGGAGVLVTRGIPIDAEIAKTGAAQKTIRETLMRSVDWDAASADFGDQVSLDVLPTHVIVRHKPKVVRQVVQTVRNLSLELRHPQPQGSGNGGGGFEAPSPTSSGEHGQGRTSGQDDAGPGSSRGLRRGGF